MAEKTARSGPVRVLLIGGTPEGAEGVRATLGAASSMQFSCAQVAKVPAASDDPDAKECDLVLLDVAVSDPGGLPTLAQARARFPNAPLVVLSDRDDEASVLTALQAGARGYLVRAELSPRLAITTLAAALGSQRAMSQLHHARERERHLATHDVLTGLPNRMLFNDRLTQAVAAARRTGRKLAVLFTDLDGFKGVNDTLGHAVGDGLLRGIARQIRSVLRETDTPARVGGDEFAVLLTQLDDESDAAIVAEKLLAALSEPVLFTPQASVTRASIGIATFPRDGEHPDELMNKADIAMYHAKKDGGHRHEFYVENMNAAVVRRVEIENGLRVALEENQLHLHYQPQYDLRRGRIVGGEALLRWKQPGVGKVRPEKFLSVAEESGLIVPIGEWVLRNACARMAGWQLEGHHGLRVSVNVAAQQFQVPGFDEVVRQVLEETGVPPYALELEITESSLLQDVEMTVTTLNKLKALGVHLAIDDFGTGYSSLAYLKRLSIDVLKIDRSFVESLATDPTDAMITATIVRMARGLGLSTIAEGVETTEQVLLLGSYGCSRMQGYLFGKPAPAETFTRWLDDPPFRWEGELPEPPEPD